MKNCRRVLALPLSFALLCACPPASLAQADRTAGAVSLSELEAWAKSAAPAVRLAQAERDVSTHRNSAAAASQGARLFGGTGVSAAREAVTDTLSRDYQRFNVQLGVRWPLLGSRDVQQRRQLETELAVAQGEVRVREAQQGAVNAVRRAYVRHLRNAQRLQVARAFMELRTAAQAQLRARRDSGLLLEAERLRLAGLFDAVQAASDTLQSQQALTLRELARLTGLPQPAVQTQPMAWPESCRNAQALLAGADQHPAIATAELEMNAWGKIAGTVQRSGLEASVSLAQGFSRDVGGPNGRSTSASLDFSMPLQWREQRDAALGQIQGERGRLESLLQVRRGEYEALAEQALAQWTLRSNEVTNLINRLRAVEEALRVATLRLEAFDGDGYAALLTMQHEWYLATNQLVDGAERRDLAAVELLALAAADCGVTAPAFDDEASAVLSAQRRPLPVSTSRANATTGLGWYVWDGQALLDNPSRLRELPQGSDRILISFTAPQLKALTQPAAHTQIVALIDQAHAAGLRVELLLGEATWVLPAGRQALLDLLAPLRKLPFDGLNLDLERSQLPPGQQKRWGRNAVDTLGSVRAAVDWPLALTTHFRELQEPGFSRQLRQAGVTEVVAMVYVSNIERVATIVRPLLQLPPGLRLTVAQSIESTLPAQESTFLAGQAQSLRRWRELARSLDTHPGFGGVLVQSLEEFSKARP